MTIAASLLPEFDQEMATTRKLLTVVPAAKADWKPHAKSWSLGELSVHLANILTWTKVTLERTELDMNPAGGSEFKTPAYESPETTVESFDANVGEARAAIEATSDQDMMVAWSLLNGGQTMFTIPRVACLRGFIMNHMIHHRGQLTVYLRQCDVPLPSVYGPTADEGM